MGTARFAVLAILVVVFQVSELLNAEEPTCAPGFQSDVLIFKVTKKHLMQGMRLGKVGFTDCTDRTGFHFSSDDGHFVVQTDGTLTVKRPVVLHKGHRDFFIHTWDLQGHRMTVLVRLYHHGHHHGHHHGDHKHHNHQHHHTEVDSANNTENAADQQVPVLEFPKSGEGLRRRNRKWAIPLIRVAENTRGPYPLEVTQFRFQEDKVKKLRYSISGPGADLPPVGLFTMDRVTGKLYVTQKLDREQQDAYTLEVHAVADGTGNAETPMDITVHVIDLNDNKPTFTQATYLGDVAEASPKDFEVITVVAIDLDEPGTDNSDIRYHIKSQDPKFDVDLFAINPITGVIRVDASGLDREKNPNHTLVVVATDMRGDGLSGEATVILTVTDGNDNTPAYTESPNAADQQVPVLEFPKSGEGLRRRRKKKWVIPIIRVSENTRGHYPLEVSHVRFREDKVKKLRYSISGPGADLPPVGLFTMDRVTGNLYVTQKLDREQQDTYTFQVHAVAGGTGNAETPMDITVHVIDQNDNKPTFTQATYLGDVAEASPKDFEVITVVAIDLDEPGTDNSDIRYHIKSQDPKFDVDLFAINPITGVIRVDASGLDREKNPNHTLVVVATDMQGDGLSGEATVILTVTDGNDNTPAYTESPNAADQQVPVLEFPKSGEGLRRRKREWVIPIIRVSENTRGPYPLKVSQVRSSEDKAKKIYYSLSGPGADLPPVGLFTMDRVTGNLYVTQELDREQQDKYTFQAHAVADGAGNTETPMDITVNVIDQNDNKPTFTQATYLGDVAEASPKDFEVITVVAIDLDEPGSDNSDIRYHIKSQDPKFDVDLFAINPITGVIRVDASGLDREKNPNHTLVVVATDMRGDGLSGEATVILTVTDGNDNTPAYTESPNAADQQVPVLEFPKSGEGLRRRKRDWVIPIIRVSENTRGHYPLEVSQIRSSEDKVKKIYYSISGPGADLPPVGLFTMDRVTGKLYVTQELDREKQDTYTFQAHAVADGAGNAETPMDITVHVIDQNDNKPTFTQATYLGEVAEASPKDFEVITVVAIDLDEPGTDNSDIRYHIKSQDPKFDVDLFAINPITGVIRVNAGGLDREKNPKHTLVVVVTDMRGDGLSGEATVILTVTDSNDNAPAYTESPYEATVEENKADARVIVMSVTDGDEPHSPAWNAKFTIVAGDPGGLFTVKTGSNKNDGIISTTKGLDFEKSRKHTLLVAVENEVPFATPLPTATATVVVNVLDVNEAPVFDPTERLVSKREDLPVDSDVVQYTASDPDTARKQKVMYKIIRDPAGWLTLDKNNTGVIKVKSVMDRESPFVKDNKYTALIGAYDNDDVPATGTGTLIIQLEDVNDNAPTIEERAIKVCNKESAPQLLSVTDKDGPGFSAPYSVSLQGMSKTNWTARMNDSKTGIILNLNTELAPGEYTVVLRVSDNQGLEQDSTVQATVCDCTGEEVICKGRVAGGTDLPVILGILGGILLLLMLLLLLLMFVRRRRGEKKEPLLQDDDIRDNIYYYDEEGGGEDDQDYDLSVLHRGLDKRPGVFRDDVVPNFMPAPRYRPRPANPDEIGNFIDDNLKTADNDPTAPPYDSLLVFDYEGGGSDAGSLSSLNSSSSGDQDYNCLNEWGPRFKKLADMYGGGEDDML